MTVNDGTVDVSDTLQVTITDSSNNPPVVGAGADQEVAEGATVRRQTSRPTPPSPSP